MMIVDDALLRVRLQLHQARHREEPQLRHRHARQAPGEGGVRAVRGRRTRQPYSPSHDRFVVSPETSRELLTAFIKAGEEAAADLRRPGQRQPDSARAAERVQGGRRDPGHRQAREGSAGGVEARKLLDLRLHVRAIIRDGDRVLHRQPEPAQAGARRPPRSRRDHHGRADREEDSGGLRGGLGRRRLPAAKAGEGQREGEGKRRTLLLFPARDDAGVDHRPVREIALKHSSSPSISAIRNA